MITLINPQNLNDVITFEANFNEVMNRTYSGNPLTIYVINEEHIRFQAIAFSTDPMATNLIIIPPVIAINTKLCEELGLNQEERHAFFAHEIGHIIDPTPNLVNDPEREYNADQFSVELGLIEELISGLEKLLEDDNYEEEHDLLKNRIIQLRNQP